ncbi:MAG: EAL domain-containing protein [Bdellovibrionales bacterium]
MDQDNSPKSFKAGDIIMKQGDEGKSAYIIEVGRVEIILTKSDGSKQSIGTRGAGAMIGEMALIDNAPRTASIRAIEDCNLLEITQDDFSQRLNNADPILKMTIQVILTRYRDTLTRSGIMSASDSCALAEAMELEYVQATSAVENIKIENDFKSALANGDISLHYQPLVNFQTDEIVGFEALMRWQHPELGFISPAQFIPVIEDSGFIVDASQWALKTSLEALKDIEMQSGHSDYFMSVNFSSHDFASDDFVDSVYEALSVTDVKPQNLHLEITERLLMGQPEQAKDTLEMCRKAGMHIAIDDFGTGYSSLSYLHYFPIDTLKIDQSFVNDMIKDKNVMTLVRSMVQLSQSMNMKTIAEGVETQEQVEALKELGCDIAQGYFYAKPMPKSDVINFLISRNQL